jgi:hypothetical protein
MEKAKLTKIQAVAVEKAKEDLFPDLIVKNKVLSEQGHSHLYGTVMKMIPLDTLIRALYIGYEVEQTEQEKIQELWGSRFSDPADKNIMQVTIKDTLKALGREDLIPKPEEEN